MHRRWGWSKPAQADCRSTTAPLIERVFFKLCEFWGDRRGARDAGRGGEVVRWRGGFGERSALASALCAAPARLGGAVVWRFSIRQRRPLAEIIFGTA